MEWVDTAVSPKVHGPDMPPLRFDPTNRRGRDPT